MTKAEKIAKHLLTLRGMSFKKNDGEYRVNFEGGEEATAYYTNDFDDAISTARHMALERDLSNLDRIGTL